VSSQVWICVGDGPHWGSPPPPEDEVEANLWSLRNSLCSAKMALMLGTRLRVVFGMSACMATCSLPDAPKLVISFDASVDPELARKVEKDLREFAEKEWSRPSTEPLDSLRKIPRSPLIWHKGTITGTTDQEQSLSPAQQRELSRQEKEFEDAMQSQGPKLMSWGDE